MDPARELIILLNLHAACNPRISNLSREDEERHPRFIAGSLTSCILRPPATKLQKALLQAATSPGLRPKLPRLSQKTSATHCKVSVYAPAPGWLHRVPGSTMRRHTAAGHHHLRAATTPHGSLSVFSHGPPSACEAVPLHHGCSGRDTALGWLLQAPPGPFMFLRSLDSRPEVLARRPWSSSRCAASHCSWNSSCVHQPHQGQAAHAMPSSSALAALMRGRCTVQAVQATASSTHTHRATPAAGSSLGLGMGLRSNQAAGCTASHSDQGLVAVAP